MTECQHTLPQAAPGVNKLGFKRTEDGDFVPTAKCPKCQKELTLNEIVDLMEGK